MAYVYVIIMDNVCTISVRYSLCNVRSNFGSYTRLHPFNGLRSTTTCVTRHQKGEPIWIFNEARDDGVAVAPAGPYANHLHLGPDR